MNVTKMILVVGVLCALVSSASAQKQELNLDQMLATPQAFFPNGAYAPTWQNDGEHFTFIRRDRARGVVWVRGSVSSDEEDVLLDGKQFAAAVKGAGLKGVGVGALMKVEWVGDTARFVAGGAVLELSFNPLQLKNVMSFSTEAAALAASPNSKRLCWVENHNIHVRSMDDEPRQVTKDGTKDLTYGVAVSRVEFGIHDGLWWSPDSQKFAFYREDFTPIKAYPYIDWKPTPAADATGRYPMAGDPGSQVQVGVYDAETGKTLYLQTDKTVDEYLTNIAWGPKSQTIYIAHVNRDQNRMDLKVYDAKTGGLLRTLFTEEDEQWVEPENPPLFLPNGSGFLWVSDRAGYNQLFLYSMSGNLMQQITSTPMDLLELKGFNQAGNGIYFTAAGPDPRQVHLFEAKLTVPHASVNSDNKGSITVSHQRPELHQVTSGRGAHSIEIAPGGRYFLDAHNNLDLPYALDLLNENGKTLRRLHQSQNPLSRFQTGTEHFFTTKSDDGTTLYGHVITPPNRVEGKKYPVLLYVYGGPHAQLVTDTYLLGPSPRALWLHYMASKGFIVVRIDNRGSANRGIEFVQSIHRQMGTLEIEDQMKALDYVDSLDFADMNRVGVHGWSYGGFMTLSLMTRKGDRFHAGISGAPVTDWKFYETGYGERYMDRPAENAVGYKTSAPAHHLKGMKGRLLLIQGSSDDTVVLQHTIDFLTHCINQGVDLDYMLYPGELHGLKGKASTHLYKKMTNFFMRELM